MTQAGNANPPESTGFLLQLTATSPPATSVPKRPARKSARPATAPPREHPLWLPSLPSGQAVGMHGGAPSQYEGTGREIFPYMQTVDENENDRMSSLGLGEHPKHLPVSVFVMPSGSLPSPFIRDGDDIPPSLNVDGLPVANQSDCDWATFMIAYASGRWDPLRTPNPPRSLFTFSSGYLSISVPPTAETLDPSNPGGQVDSLRRVPGDSPQTHSTLQNTRVLATEDVPNLENSLSGTSTLSVPPSTNKFRAPAPAKILLPAYRMRNSYSTSAAPSPGSNTVGPTPPAHSNQELQTVVATMRWAAARVDISPLALPSPEHELTDPMRGVTATVPGSYPQENNQPDHPPTPGTIRKSRSFWHGTTDVENGSSKPNVSSPHLATIEASPEVDTRPETTVNRQLETAAAIATPLLNHQCVHPQTATAPCTSSWTLTTQSSTGPPNPPDYFGTHPEQQEGSVGIMSAPALPRQAPLTRQTSSPLPAFPSRDPIISGGRVVPDPSRTGRATKEEQMFAELGYLPPPNPPDELERRRALYKCDSSFRHLVFRGD
jgi:hypothetical protein